MILTEKLKYVLWKHYGNTEYPAEWDGNGWGGGGKISQRFWEYFQAIELLELTSDSVVLDIGGGSPETGVGFFSNIMASFVKEVHILDVNVGENKTHHSNVVFHKQLGNYEVLRNILSDNKQITHIASVSVFEHAPDEARCGIVKAIDEFFNGDIFVSTLEYHSKKRYFEHQLTTKSVSKLFSSMDKFYLSKIVQSPVLSENAYSLVTNIPRWYPLALQFRRVPEI